MKWEESGLWNPKSRAAQELGWGGGSCPLGARAKGLRNRVKCLGQGSSGATSVTCSETDARGPLDTDTHQGSPWEVKWLTYLVGWQPQKEGGRKGRKQGGWEGEREGRREGRYVCIKAQGRVKARTSSLCWVLHCLVQALLQPGQPMALSPPSDGPATDPTCRSANPPSASGPSN